jgi:hypothetical protein
MPTVNYGGTTFQTVPLVDGFEWIFRDYPNRRDTWYWSDYHDETDSYTHYIYLDESRLLAIENVAGDDYRDASDASDLVDQLCEAKEEALRAAGYTYRTPVYPTFHIRWNGVSRKFEYLKIKYAVQYFKEDEKILNTEFPTLSEAFKFYKGLAFPNMTVERAVVLEIANGKQKIIRSCTKE